MHQRQSSSYGRRFLYGKHKPSSFELDLKAIWSVPGIGLIPPEFDDLDGGEHEQVEQLRASFTPP